MKPPLMKPPDIHLRIAKEHVKFLNSIPEFRDLSTTQLWIALPAKYRKHVPPINNQDDTHTRAVLIGMLAHPAQIESHIGTLFLERL